MYPKEFLFSRKAVKKIPKLKIIFSNHLVFGKSFKQLLFSTKLCQNDHMNSNCGRKLKSRVTRFIM